MFALTTATLGAGSLSLPYAFQEAGLVAGLLLLAGIGLISLYTIHFIVATLTVPAAGG